MSNPLNPASLLEVSPDSKRRIAILGSTGSIGVSTLKIVEAYPERFSVTSLAAGNNVEIAFEQCRRWQPKLISMATEERASELKNLLNAVGLRLIDESGNGQRLHAGGDAGGLAGGVVSATGEGGADGDQSKKPSREHEA